MTAKKAPRKDTAATSTADKRDPAKVEQYKEAIVRLGRLQPGTPEYQRNADIVKAIGTEYGLSWQDKIKTAPAASDPASVQPDPGAVPPQGETVKPDGQIDQDAANARLEAQRQKDREDQFKLDNPDEVDEYGNTVTYKMGPDGKPIRTVTLGDTAKRFRDLATSAADGYDPETDRQKAQDATYGTLTKYYDRDMARENEDAKQEMANRGIPYDPAAAQDPNSKNLYGRTIGGIAEKYRGLKDNAAQQAVLSGNDAFRTTSAARDSFIQTATAGANSYGADFKGYVNNVTSKSGDDSLALLSMTAEQYARLRGVSVQEAQTKIDEARLKEQERANKASEGIARAAAARSGGGGGGGGGGSGSGGFEIQG